jgi:hypothetical protein
MKSGREVCQLAVLREIVTSCPLRIFDFTNILKYAWDGNSFKYMDGKKLSKRLNVWESCCKNERVHQLQNSTSDVSSA